MSYIEERKLDERRTRNQYRPGDEEPTKYVKQANRSVRGIRNPNQREVKPMTSNVTIASCPSCSCPIQATLSIKTEAKGEMKPDAEGNVVITGRVTGARIASHDCVPKVTR